MRQHIAAGLDTMFSIAGDAAVYRAAGTGPETPIRIILSRPDEEINLGRADLRTATTVGDVRISEVPGLAKNDTITVNGEVFRVRGRDRDPLRLLWVVDLQ